MACNPECPQSFPQWVHLHFKCLKAPSPGLCQALPSATCPVLPLQNGVKFILGHQGRGRRLVLGPSWPARVESLWPAQGDTGLAYLYSCPSLTSDRSK
jgi:hypothetical protein